MTHKTCCLLLSLVPLAASAQPMPRYRWQNFTTADGLPDNRVFSVAVYGALVPASRFVPSGGSDEKKKSPGRANSAKFVKALCLYFGEPRHFRRRKGTSSSRTPTDWQLHRAASNR